MSDKKPSIESPRDPARAGSTFPAFCPGCGKPEVSGYVRGFWGWECGSLSKSHHTLGGELNFVQSIECAVEHWKQRALRAEYLLTLIPVPNAAAQMTPTQNKINNLQINESTSDNASDRARLVRPAFALGEMVSHITNENSEGMIVGFMMRGSNHSYEVQWGIEKCIWHLDFELRAKLEQPRQIGFWSENGLPNA